MLNNGGAIAIPEEVYFGCRCGLYGNEFLPPFDVSAKRMRRVHENQVANKDGGNAAKGNG